MALSVTRTLVDPPHFSPLTNCYFHNSCVACLANGAYRWMRWEGQRTIATDADLTDSQVRVFGSSDDGQSWSLLATHILPFKTQWLTVMSPDGIRLLAGINDKAGYAYDASFSGILRSEDGGLTWASAISSGVFATLNPGLFACRTERFVRLPGTTTVLAFGRYDTSGGVFTVMRSTDTGLTFTPFSDVGAFLIGEATALSATVVVCTDINGADAFYSTDAGATWTVVPSLPLLSDLFGPFVSMGSGEVLSLGRTTSSNLGAIWRSTDSGQTYTFFSFLGSEINGTRTLIRLTPTTLIAGSGGPSPAIIHEWWLSEDAGVTWASATLIGTHISNAASGSIIITNTGTMLADLDDPLNGAREAALWRGLVDGLFTTVGTCEAVEVEPPEPPEPEGAVLGIRLDCVPILSPAPCPPFCPVDPVGPVAQLIFPVAPSGPGGGWRSALPLLGLADGTEALTVTPALLTRPSACGATFANNNCAVVGA